MNKSQFKVWRSNYDKIFNSLTKDFDLLDWQALRNDHYWRTDLIQDPIARLKYRIKLVESYIKNNSMKSEKPTKQRSKLASLMKSRGVTQRELTDQINEVFKDTETSRDTISRYCSGNRPNVHLTTILKICVVLDVTPNDIIEYE